MAYIAELKELRISLGWSQAELARKAGIDRDTVYRCENEYNVQEPKCALIKRALETAGCVQPVQIVSGGRAGRVQTV